MIGAIQSEAPLGPYEVGGVLGSGALGVVYRARQASLDRDVALKVLSPALALDADLVERFEREARTAASLSHPHIVTIYDTGAARGFHYIAMELLEGQTLNRLQLPLQPHQAAVVLRPLCEALSYAHRQGVVHRDLKPENVIMSSGGHVTLTDFGVARVVGQARLTLREGPVGTPEFMSPEQAKGESADARSDIYSLGILLWYLLVGHSPFLSENVLATMYRQIHEPLPPLPPGIPAPLAAWVDCCCRKDPLERYSSGEEALAALKKAVASFPAGGEFLPVFLPGSRHPDHPLLAAPYGPLASGGNEPVAFRPPGLAPSATLVQPSLPAFGSHSAGLLPSGGLLPATRVPGSLWSVAAWSGMFTLSVFVEFVLSMHTSAPPMAWVLWIPTLLLSVWRSSRWGRISFLRVALTCLCMVSWTAIQGNNDVWPYIMLLSWAASMGMGGYAAGKELTQRQQALPSPPPALPHTAGQEALPSARR